ncbi:polysaccharide biosynthesis protein [Flammeovirgaceae bacterium 311]|nr:polysaccharide biosynthesis protein [Flammeovirgaceae bacterium 311]
MGFILNRSIFVSLITYVGVVIGYLNVLWLYPKVMDLEEIGLFRTLQDIALLFVPFAQMGAGQGLIRYFPHGTTKTEQQQIVSLSLAWSLFSFLFFLLIFWLLQDWIYLFFDEKAGAVNNYLPVVLLLTFILNLQGVLEPLARSLLKFRFVAFSKEILLRVLSAALIILYFFGLLSFNQAVWGLVVVYGTVTLMIAFHLVKSGWATIHFTYFPQVKNLIPPFIRYGLITFLSSASSLLVMKTDSIMVTQMIGLEANGIYTTVFFMAVIVELPRRILSQISTPLLSQAFEQNDMQLAQKIYQKSSINLLLISALLYIGIICNMSALFSVMPKGEAFQTGAMVVILIGIGKLVDGAAGVNGEILVMSRYYRINLYFTIVMAILNVLLNYLFIPIWGIEGAALGSCLSLIFFNLLKYFYLQIKLQLQPFSQNTLLLLLILGAAFAAGWFLPALANPFLDIVVRSLLITAIVAAGVLYFKVSEEANALVQKLWQYRSGKN